jgi:uncharacterized RDD family membrane protein YckC
MTDPAGGAPTPQSSGSWQSPPPPQGGYQAPPPPVAPPPAQGGGNWQTPPPAAPGGFDPSQFQQAAVEVGPAPGVAYADLVSRIIAAFIDGLIIGIPFAIVSGIINMALPLFIGGIVSGAVYLAASVGYFVYTWTTMRTTFGMKFLKLEVVSAADGSTLTQNQAITRWAWLYGLVGVGMVVPIIGILILLAGGVYELYLLYTVTQSPKRQGFHDVKAGTVVVKRG